MLELSLDIYSGREEIAFLMSQTSRDLGDKLPLSLEPTLERVCYLNREKEGNEYFIDYITSMQTREDACIKIKNCYEGYHRN